MAHICLCSQTPKDLCFAKRKLAICQQALHAPGHHLGELPEIVVTSDACARTLTGKPESNQKASLGEGVTQIMRAPVGAL